MKSKNNIVHVTKTFRDVTEMSDLFNTQLIHQYAEYKATMLFISWWVHKSFVYVLWTCLTQKAQNEHVFSIFLHMDGMGQILNLLSIGDEVGTVSCSYLYDDRQRTVYRIGLDNKWIQFMYRFDMYFINLQFIKLKISILENLEFFFSPMHFLCLHSDC